MKTNILGVIAIYGLWMLVHNNQAKAGSQTDFCLFPVDLDDICSALNQLHQKMESLESKLNSKNDRDFSFNNELIAQFISQLRDQLDKEADHKAEIDQLKLQHKNEKNEMEITNKLLADEKTRIENNLSEDKANLEKKIKSLERSNKLLNEEKILIENQLSKVKDDLGHQIESLRNTNNLLETELSQCTVPPSSCSRLENPSGIHGIKLPQLNPFFVRCESNIAGPGWTVIEKRFDGSVDFQQNWHNYSVGFGSMGGEFFLGLQKIHLLTNYETHELYAHLEHFDGRTEFERCKKFKVGSEEEGFTLSVGECTEQEDDSISFNNGFKFSTYDRDNDLWTGGDCALVSYGGWWYNGRGEEFCSFVHPNGRYNYINWFGVKSLKSVQLLIRPTSSTTDN